MESTSGCFSEPSTSSSHGAASNASSNPYYRLTFGTLNWKDPRFLRDTPGKKELTLGQNHSIVIVAWMYRLKYDPDEWNVDHLDNIICRGNWLHFNFRCRDGNDDVYKQYNVDSTTFLETINCGTFAINGEPYRFEALTKLAFFGKFTGLRSKLKKYMDTCDELSCSILFTCKQLSFGIFAYMGNDDGVEYCLFDPHGRNSDGFFDYTGNSCLLCFKTIDNLIDLLARDGIFAHSLYECVPMKKSPITYKVNGIVTITLHNTRKFIDGYLYGSDDWDADSVSSDAYDYYSDFNSDESEDEVPSAKPVEEKLTASGRQVKAPKRLEFDPHPSFFRGKLREDKKRLEGKWNEWYRKKTPEERRNVKKRKRINWTLLAKANMRKKLHENQMSNMGQDSFI